MRLFKLINFCFFFNEINEDLPNWEQVKMFWLAEGKDEVVTKEFFREDGATTFLASYCAWKSLRADSGSVLYLTNYYGSRKAVDALKGQINETLIINCDTKSGQLKVEGLSADLVLIDNENINEENLIYTLTNAKKVIFYFTQ